MSVIPLNPLRCPACGSEKIRLGQSTFTRRMGTLTYEAATCSCDSCGWQGVPELVIQRSEP